MGARTLTYFGCAYSRHRDRVPSPLPKIRDRTLRLTPFQLLDHDPPVCGHRTSRRCSRPNVTEVRGTEKAATRGVSWPVGQDAPAPYERGTSAGCAGPTRFEGPGGHDPEVGFGSVLRSWRQRWRRATC